MKLSSIKRDTNAAETGVWINKVYQDLDLKIASAGNRKYLDMLRQLMKPYQRNYKTMADEIFVEIQNRAIAKHVLVDWRNLQDDLGNDIAYTPEKAFELLQDAENSDFRKLVVDLSEEAELFRKEALEELVGK